MQVLFKKYIYYNKRSKPLKYVANMDVNNLYIY